MRYLMTHSLLSSWIWSMKDSPYADATNEADPMESFMRVLRREPGEVTDAIQNGNEFEELVTDIASGWDRDTKHWHDAAAQIAQKVRGGVFQFKGYKDAQICGMDVLLYGKLDVLKAGTIYDIKFSKNYDVGKFFESTQHPMYFELVPEADRFEYLVSNGSGVWTEAYRRDETRSILPDIEAFYGWLETVGLMDLYREYWCSK